MKYNLEIVHGHETHSLEDAKKCPECKEVAEEFERDFEEVIQEVEDKE